MRFRDKVVVVTGAASGIGLATARAFAREGATVVAADINPVDGVRCDVTRPDDVAALFEDVASRYGRVDCAVNNAGIEGSRTSIAEADVERWKRVIDVNLFGVFLCLKYELSMMSGGAIVNLASIFGSAAVPTGSDYVASKHAVVGLTKCAALEAAPRGIRVNAVAPGYIDTPMVTERAPASRSEIEQRMPLNRLGTPEEVAESILWLCSDAASFVTGHVLAVDGGFLAR